MVNNMMVVDTYDNQEVDNEISRLNERITTLEKTNDELNQKLNQRDAYLKICYVNIALLSTLLILIGAMFLVKKLRKSK
jgi:hypothetical protein